MHPDPALVKAAETIAHAYCRCSPGHSTTFHMMVGLSAGLCDLSLEKAIGLCVVVFPCEASAFFAELDGLPYATRFQIDFGDTAQWN